jgi:hypothetical protein
MESVVWAERHAGKSPSGSAFTTRTESYGDQCEEENARTQHSDVVRRLLAIQRALRGRRSVHVRVLMEEEHHRVVFVHAGAHSASDMVPATVRVLAAEDLGPFYTSERRGGVERRQVELKGVEVCRD